MNETTPPPPEKVTLATARVPLSKLIYLAQREGLFAREGLDLTLVTAEHGKDAFDLMLAGKADLSASSTMPITSAILEGAKPALLASLCKSDADIALVMRDIDSTYGLQGKKVGVSYRTSAHYYLHNLLVDAGISHKEVQLIDMDPAVAINQLADGKLDATAQFFPWQERAASAIGPDAIVESPPIYTTHWILAADRDFLEQRPQAVQKILRALLAAEKLASEQPELANRAVTDVPDAMPDSARYMNRYKAEVLLTQSMIITMESEARWHSALNGAPGTAQQIPNFLEFVESGPLRTVRPETVKITE